MKSAKKPSATKKANIKKMPAKKPVSVKGSAPIKKAAAQVKGPQKAPAKKAVSVKAAPVKVAPAKKVAPIKAAPAKKTTPVKAAPVKKTAPPVKAAPVKKAAPPVKAAPTKVSAKHPQKVAAAEVPSVEKTTKAKIVKAPVRTEPKVQEVAEVADVAEDIVLTDAEGRRYCRIKDCDRLAEVDTYCRYHYILLWKNIQIRRDILQEGKLERYIEELTSRYPDKFLEILKKDLRSEKDFTAAIQELEIDESAVEAEYDDEETQSDIFEAQRMSDASGSSDRSDSDDRF